MLTESFPVKHKTISKLGAGIVVGGFPTSEVNDGKVVTNFYFLVLWEHNAMPSPHKNVELEHLTDHEQWFANYFEDDSDDSEEEEEEEEEEEDFNNVAGTSLFEEEVFDETIEPEIEVLNPVITNDQALNNFENDQNTLDM